VCRHVAELDRLTELPISADLENGYGARPEDAAQAIRRAAEAGAVGGSIEDWDPEHGLYDREQAVERVHAAAEAANCLDFPFVLTARAENHIRGNSHLEDTIERLQAFQAVGADVLYAPGLRNVAKIKAVCDAVSNPVKCRT
jgi:2-methylisocitrate lyase-like PEP mutase family enzyme